MEDKHIEAVDISQEQTEVIGTSQEQTNKQDVVEDYYETESRQFSGCGD